MIYVVRCIRLLYWKLNDIFIVYILLYITVCDKYFMSVSYSFRFEVTDLLYFNIFRNILLYAKMHIIFIEFFHGKHSNTCALRCSCANEISFMYKIKLSPSPCFLADVKWPQRVRNLGKYTTPFLLGQIRLPWFVGQR